ncbi:hypothetical protein HRI96_07095 [Treponema parvum]|uniref:Uncharacterized protein n=1 Tax=Treponema parvum TaxID=138851 RepID=A0A975F073_9SPIR|nr:hypothetical protein [Treponema parvum]QTQ11977.1 hypothetical protein HRI96_07095 [Treponema parvum]
MNIKRITVTFTILIFLLHARAAALSVVIQVIQQYEDANETLEPTRIFAQDLVDCFFEYGDIVTDAPVILCADSHVDEDALNRVLIEAAQGYMDFFAKVTLEYEKGGFVKDGLPENGPVLKKIGWELVSVAQNKRSASGVKTIGSARTKRLDEMEIQDFAVDVAKQIKIGSGK